MFIKLQKCTWVTEREEIQTPTSELLLRKAIIANAMWAEGLSAGVVEQREAFEFMLGKPPIGVEHFDLDRPFRVYAKKADGRMATQGVSTCGLVAERILELSGVGWPWRDQPYSIGTAISRSIGWATRRRVWSSKGMPKPGDLCVIGNDLDVHAFVVIANSGSVVVSIDGGQIDGRKPPGVKCTGLQRIAKCARRWMSSGKQMLLGGKVYKGFVDIGLISKYLLLYNKANVPKGWNTDG